MTRPLVLDPDASTLIVHTRASGMLARLAHDLEIAASGLEGRADFDDATTWNGTLTAPVARLQVVGVLRDRSAARGRVTADKSVLSASDRADILERMRDDALRGAHAIRVTAKGSLAQAEFTIAIDGRAVQAQTPIDLHDAAGRVTVRARIPLSLRALGAREIKGPLAAFVVNDEVVVWIDLAFSA